MDLRIESLTDIDFLRQIGIDVFPTERNYWFIRTQRGTYYEDFINENFVGIEWDKISDKEFIEKAKEDDLKVEVVKHYPDVDRPGYVASQISKFSNEMKKGDIVLIPNAGSKWISFGELLDNEMYIHEEDEEDDFQTILDEVFEQPLSEEGKPFLKKRRKVKWIKQVKRTDLDPYLFSIIYSHNAIVDANDYSLFIDRTLSQFYIKGDEAYYTFKVNKKKNIPYCDILQFLNNNSAVIKYINNAAPNLIINAENLILKINVQSKGPIQLKGPVKGVLIFGLIVSVLFGAKVKFKVPGFEYNLETKGLPGLLEEVNEFVENKIKANKDEEVQRIIEQLEEDRKKLEIKLPDLDNEEETTVESSEEEEVLPDDILNGDLEEI